MNAVRMTSSPVGTDAGDGANAHTSSPSAAFRASTRVDTATSRSVPEMREFSISSSETTSASRPLIAATILACWRSRFASSAAPRGAGPLLQVFTVTGLPARSL